MRYKPEYLHEWSLPQDYIGATWEGFYSSGCGQSRDSDALERSNFECLANALEEIDKPEGWEHDGPCWQIVNESHWLVGWVDWIAIHPEAESHLQVADEIAKGLEDYPVVDEEHFSETEWEDAFQTWQKCYSDRERLAYIRDNRDDFEFCDWADLRRNVRGESFCGSTEILY